MAVVAIQCLKLSLGCPDWLPYVNAMMKDNRRRTIELGAFRIELRMFPVGIESDNCLGERSGINALGLGSGFQIFVAAHALAVGGMDQLN
jgi:hypothetical protein